MNDKETEKNSERQLELPATEELEAELEAVRYRQKLMRAIRGTIYTLITVAAATVLIAVLVMPVLHIYGTSMNPTLDEDNIVVCRRTKNFDTGDIIAFYYNNKILIKRVIGKSGDWIDIDKYGNVYVNDERIDEPYITDKAFGECDISLPYQVPESRVFVMGDHRNVSIDSRSSSVGCVAHDEIVGKIMLRIWPLSEFKIVK